MTYGIGTPSFRHSPEHRQMQQDRKEATSRHLGLCHCGVPAQHLCAWKVPKWQRFPGQESDRCQRPVCNVHAKIVTRLGDEPRALCPEHQRSYDDYLAKKHKQGELNFTEAA